MDFLFTRDRYRHALLERAGDVCLVERTNLVTDAVHWEVVVLQHRHARTLPNGDHVPAHDAYPASEDWGTLGWTYTNITDARRRYADLRRRGAPTGGVTDRGKHIA